MLVMKTDRTRVMEHPVHNDKALVVNKAGMLCRKHINDTPQHSTTSNSCAGSIIQSMSQRRIIAVKDFLESYFFVVQISFYKQNRKRQGIFLKFTFVNSVERMLINTKLLIFFIKGKIMICLKIIHVESKKWLQYTETQCCLFLRPRQQYIYQLSKIPATSGPRNHSWNQQPLVVRNHSMQLGTTFGIRNHSLCLLIQRVVATSGCLYHEWLRTTSGC